MFSTPSSTHASGRGDDGMSDTPKKSNPFTRYGEARKERIDQLAQVSARERTPVLVGAGGLPPEDVTVSESGTIVEKPGVSLWKSAWLRLRRNPVFLLGLAITILFILIAIFAPWIAPKDPITRYLIDEVRPQTNPIPGPRPGFPLGA